MPNKYEIECTMDQE